MWPRLYLAENYSLLLRSVPAYRSSVQSTWASLSLSLSNSAIQIKIYIYLCTIKLTLQNPYTGGFVNKYIPSKTNLSQENWGRKKVMCIRGTNQIISIFVAGRVCVMLHVHVCSFTVLLWVVSLETSTREMTWARKQRPPPTVRELTGNVFQRFSV